MVNFENFNNFDVIIVGSGFFGATIAEKITDELNLKVAVLEKRFHTGGNSYSVVDEETQIEYHKYGSHIFHTNNKKVWDYCNKFTEFNNYRHKVLTIYKNQIYSMPINLSTINQFYGKNLNPEQAEVFMKSIVIEENHEDNFESKAISLIGRDLYEAFIKGYTLKQWQMDPRELPSTIISRLPVRYSYNTEYFDDFYQGIPIDGYTSWINKLLAKSKVFLNVDFFDIKDKISKEKLIIYTGPIDKYFNYKFGELTWRTLDFELEIHSIKDYQGLSVMNYADLDVDYTRIHEFKHLHPERTHSENQTLIMKEFSRFAKTNDEPYYPVNSKSDREKLNKYRELIKQEKNVLFGGRLGSYQYLDMHMAIASALNMFQSEVKEKLNKIYE